MIDGLTLTGTQLVVIFRDMAASSARENGALEAWEELTDAMVEGGFDYQEDMCGASE